MAESATFSRLRYQANEAFIAALRLEKEHVQHAHVRTGRATKSCERCRIIAGLIKDFAGTVRSIAYIAPQFEAVAS